MPPPLPRPPLLAGLGDDRCRTSAVEMRESLVAAEQELWLYTVSLSEEHDDHRDVVGAVDFAKEIGKVTETKCEEENQNHFQGASCEKKKKSETACFEAFSSFYAQNDLGVF